MLHLSIATSCTCSVVQSLKSLAQFTQCVIHAHFAFTSAHCFLLKRFDVHTYSSIKILWYKTESKINTGENCAKLIGYNLWAKKSGRPFIHWASHLDPSAPTCPLLYKAIYCKAFKHRDHFYWSHHSRSINNAVAGQATIIYNYKHFQFTFWNIDGHLEYDAAWITKVSKICETIAISVI